MQIAVSKGQIIMSFEGYTDDELYKIKEIFDALVVTGGLSGVKRGKTIIHFDEEGLFHGVQLDYWPWKRRKGI